MTTEDERFCAIDNTREFLKRIVLTRPVIAHRALREQAQALLRHYPGPADVEEMRRTKGQSHG